MAQVEKKTNYDFLVLKDLGSIIQPVIKGHNSGFVIKSS